MHARHAASRPELSDLREKVFSRCDNNISRNFTGLRGGLPDGTVMPSGARNNMVSKKLHRGLSIVAELLACPDCRTKSRGYIPFTKSEEYPID